MAIDLRRVYSLVCLSPTIFVFFSFPHHPDLGGDGLEEVVLGLLVFEGMGKGFESLRVLLEGVDESVELLDAPGLDAVSGDEVFEAEVLPLIAGTTLILILLGGRLSGLLKGGEQDCMYKNIRLPEQRSSSLGEDSWVS